MPTDKTDQTKKTKTFEIDMEGVDGERYRGTFIVKRMTLADWGELGVLKSKLSGGYYTVRDEYGEPTGVGLDPTIDYMISAWAQCWVATKLQRPDWFDRETLEDNTVLNAVYKEVTEFENSFRKSRGNAGDGEGSGEKEHEGGERPEGVPEDLVEQPLPKIVKKR